MVLVYLAEGQPGPDCSSPLGLALTRHVCGSNHGAVLSLLPEVPYESSSLLSSVAQVFVLVQIRFIVCFKALPCVLSSSALEKQAVGDGDRVTWPQL